MCKVEMRDIFTSNLFKQWEVPDEGKIKEKCGRIYFYQCDQCKRIDCE